PGGSSRTGTPQARATLTTGIGGCSPSLAIQKRARSAGGLMSRSVSRTTIRETTSLQRTYVRQREDSSCRISLEGHKKEPAVQLALPDRSYLRTTVSTMAAMAA